MKEKFELTVEGKMENLARIGEFIEETMHYYSIDNPRDVHAVQLSVDEACTNIIEHAYSSMEGKIVVGCMLTDSKFIVEISDWGGPFDPTTLPEPDVESGLSERKAGGLGIFFMKKFMDEVSYLRRDDKNLLTIAKYIKK
ncbi:MAG: ATP-binding protein [Candidatus Bathyarchaeota archaeon]|nr:ATP-binding protein [Candidatus Bathyarchaeota archaeon]